MARIAQTNRVVSFLPAPSLTILGAAIRGLNNLAKTSDTCHGVLGDPEEMGAPWTELGEPGEAKDGPRLDLHCPLKITQGAQKNASSIFRLLGRK